MCVLNGMGCLCLKCVHLFSFGVKVDIVYLRSFFVRKIEYLWAISIRFTEPLMQKQMFDEDKPTFEPLHQQLERNEMSVYT